MKNLIIKAIFTTFLFCISNFTIAAECESFNNEISLTQIESIFQQMETKSKWNTKAELLWGYFFFDSDKEKLIKLSTQLASEEYREVELFFNGRSYVLHIERPEIHTPQSLATRNAYFATLAQKNCIKTYDGFDVGPYAKK